MKKYMIALFQPITVINNETMHLTIATITQQVAIHIYSLEEEIANRKLFNQ